jgi:hypothetical protein
LLTFTKKPKQSKKTVAPDNDGSSECDEDKPKKHGRPAKVTNKPKREPSAYNKYVKDQPDVPTKDRMKLAAADWKSLTKQEQEGCKT